MSPGIGALPPGRPQAGPDVLAGGPPPDSQQPGQDKSAALMSNVRISLTAIDNLARQHPEMADAADEAKKKLTNRMMDVIGQGSTTPTRGISPPG